MGNLTIAGVFAAGLVSFLSPCVIPLIPMYMGFLAGDVAEGSKSDRKKLFLNAIFFLLGLLTVFTLLGAGASQLGKLLFANSKLLTKIAGLFIVFFGVFQLGLFRPAFMKGDKRFRLKATPGRLSSAFLLGVAFSFGWSPCVGPILGSVMALASSQESLHTGIMLLIVYSAGFSIPFLLSIFILDPMMKVLEKSEKALMFLKIATGLLMIALGIMVYTGKINALIRLLS